MHVYLGDQVSERLERPIQLLPAAAALGRVAEGMPHQLPQVRGGEAAAAGALSRPRDERLEGGEVEFAARGRPPVAASLEHPRLCRAAPGC